MKRVLLTLLFVLCAALTSAAALADVRWGIYFNAPFPLWAPWYYYPPPYSYPYPYYPPPILTPPPAAPYIEQAPARAAPPPPPDWFYCPGSRNYYPYVRECPGGWQRVPSTPQSMR